MRALIAVLVVVVQASPALAQPADAPLAPKAAALTARLELLDQQQAWLDDQSGRARAARVMGVVGFAAGVGAGVAREVARFAYAYPRLQQPQRLDVPDYNELLGIFGVGVAIGVIGTVAGVVSGWYLDWTGARLQRERRQLLEERASAQSIGWRWDESPPLVMTPPALELDEPSIESPPAASADQPRRPLRPYSR